MINMIRKKAWVAVFVFVILFFLFMVFRAPQINVNTYLTIFVFFGG